MSDTRRLPEMFEWFDEIGAVFVKGTTKSADQGLYMPPVIGGFAGARIQFTSPASVDDGQRGGYFAPAQTVDIYGTGQIIKLRDMLNKIIAASMIGATDDPMTEAMVREVVK